MTDAKRRKIDLKMGLISKLLIALSIKKDNNNLPNIVHQNNSIGDLHILNNIREDILPLLYFKNGKWQNINSTSNEPSAIDLTLTISTMKPDPTGYFPSYESLTPAQRYYFLNWLSSLNKVDDLGYPFLLLYCLERHIYENDRVTNAVSIIKQLQNTFDNDSFNYYSSVAVVWATKKYNNVEYLSGLNLYRLPFTISVFLNLFFQKKLEADFIISNASKIGWTNKRYIRKYPELFKKELITYLEQNYGQTYFPVPSNIDKNNIHFSSLLLSNYSIPEDDRLVSVPDLLKTKEVGYALLAALMKTHEKVKSYLKTHQSKYKKEKESTIKVFNSRTGYPMAKASSIERSKRELKEFGSDDYSKSELLRIASESANENGANMAIQRYSLAVLENRPLKGEIAYKTGDWDTAEEILLPCITINSESAKRLSIIYRRQKRFKDEVDMLQTAIISWQSSAFNVYKGTFIELEERLSKAKDFYQKHKEEDESIGFKLQVLPYDKQFLHQLINIRNSHMEQSK